MQRIVEWLPKHGQPWAIRFLGSTLIMAIAVTIQLTLTTLSYTSPQGLFVLLPAVFCVAVSFDRWTGFYASAIAIGAAYVTLTHPFQQVPTHTGDLAFSVLCGVMAIFSVLCVLMAVFGEGLRKALERAVDAERTSDILLRELQHRTQNTLTIVVSLLELQARASANPEVKAALNGAAARVRIQSEAHRHLTLKSAGRVDARQYLTEVCHLLEQSLTGVRPIRIECRADDVTVDAPKALALGLITNELITNSMKYAFKESEPGTIKVALDRDESERVRLRVGDNGSGCPDSAAPGVGTRLINALVKEHKGTYERVNAERGCEVTVTFSPQPA